MPNKVEENIQNALASGKAAAEEYKAKYPSTTSDSVYPYAFGVLSALYGHHVGNLEYEIGRLEVKLANQAEYRRDDLFETAMEGLPFSLSKRDKMYVESQRQKITFPDSGVFLDDLKNVKQQIETILEERE